MKNPPGGQPASQKPKLLDQAREAIRAKQYSLRTEKAYIERVKKLHEHDLKTGAGAVPLP